MPKYQFLQPLHFSKKDVTLKNRIVIPPMTEQMAFHDGTVTQDQLRYYSLHTGGVGMYTTAVANVNDLGKGFEGEFSIAHDEDIPGLTRLANAIKQNGTKAIVQIFSAGRMTSSQVLRGQQPVSASAVAAPRPGMETPRALTGAEVQQTIKDFGAAVHRAIVAGFDGVELHGANTYLLQQFFSPHSNRRTDDWGGNVQARMRFPLAVVDEAARVVAADADRPFLLGYRISPEELEKPGITIDDTLQLVDALAEKPLDYLHVSNSDVWRTSIRDHNDQRVVNTLIKERLAGRLPMIVVSGMRTPAMVAKAAEVFDLVALGKESLIEPQWVEKVQAGEESAIRYAVAESDLPELGIEPPFWQMILRTAGGAENVPVVKPD
ncbi:NADH-dependent flavin oxidoreductase [Schleiferilactobacillus shenzhenensis]|uniref:YqiG n=1 Tax=Schleiferilactobacillus shenzhenensis LY-73 TaxID=1231336 RepID=U4TX96_9LACO|nr:NADH-dependent flavin oxidoreductase [Schleiferilactobacillus shenzhenensis]ERL65972.1 YqiG [Schleiferilactobacillus shenzhenensis LY-73]